MEKLKLNIAEKLLTLNLFICFFISVSVYFRQSQLTSILFRTMFVIIIITIIYDFVSKKCIINKTFIYLFFVLLFSFLIIFIRNKSDFSIDYFTKYFSFSATLLYFFLAIFTNNVSPKIKKTIKIIFLGYSIFYFYCFFVRGNVNSLYFVNVDNNGSVKYLTFGYNNPNLAGQYMACLFFYAVFLFFSNCKYKLEKVFYALSAVIFLYFAFLTKSRNTIIGCLVFVAFTVYYLLSNKKISKTMINIIILFPIFFALLYLIIINNLVIIQKFQFLVSTGKTLDSRLSIWKFGFTKFIQHPLFGQYYEIMRYLPLKQLHNTHLDILSSYGIIIFSGFLIILSKIVKFANTMVKSNDQKICLIAFLSCLVLGMGESALFTSGLGLYILVGTLLLYIKCDSKL